MFKYIKILVVLPLILSACTGSDRAMNSIHSLPIIGETKIEIKENGKICFEPLFETAKFNGKPYSIEQFRLYSIVIRDAKHRKQGSLKLDIVPKALSSKRAGFINVYEGQSICTNPPEGSSLIQTVSAPMIGDLIVEMNGSDSGEGFDVVFFKNFYYEGN